MEHETASAIVERYNAAAPGTRMDARIKDYGASLRMWFLEAGIRHFPAREADGSWRLAIERRGAAAQGSMPGVHHVVQAPGSIWACERAQRVARIDAGSRQVAAVRRVARRGAHLAIDEETNRLFLADTEAQEVVALRAADLAELARWPAPGRPQLPLAGPDGIVCVTGENGTVTLAWPTGTAYRSTTFTVGALPHDPLIAGEHLFVPCAGDGEIYKLRLSDGALIGRVPVGDGPSHLALHPDTRRIYSANSWDGTVSCLTVDGERVASGYSGGWAHAIECSPDGRRLYVANFMDDSISVLDADTLERVALLGTDAYPHGLDLSPDGRYLVATGFAAEHVRVFDALSCRELARVQVGRGSSHTAFVSDSAWIACSVSDHVACVDLTALACTARLHLDD